MSDSTSETLRESPLFLFGIPRSGTTLLMSLLDGHPQLVVSASESQFFVRFVPGAKALDANGKLALAQKTLLRHFQNPADEEAEENHRRLYVSHIEYEDVKEKMRGYLQNGARHFGDYLSASVLAYADADGQLSPRAKYWLEKTPNHEMYAETLLRWWPRAKCIHVMRDPRGTYAALNKRDPARYNVDAVAYLWERSARHLFAHEARWGKEQYLRLRYEDMVRQPQETMRRICGFLQIEEAPSLYEPTKSGGKHPWGGNSAHGQKFSGIDARSLEKWRETANPKDIALIESLLRSPMQELGYDFMVDSGLSTSVQSVPLRFRMTARHVRQAKRNNALLADVN